MARRRRRPIAETFGAGRPRLEETWIPGVELYEPAPEMLELQAEEIASQNIILFGEAARRSLLTTEPVAETFGAGVPLPEEPWRPIWAESGAYEPGGPQIPELPEPVLFEPEEAPEIEETPAVPEPAGPGEETAAMREERLRLRRRRGFRSTVLTSPQGVLGEPSVVRRTLLGE